MELTQSHGCNFKIKLDMETNNMKQSLIPSVFDANHFANTTRAMHVKFLDLQVKRIGHRNRKRSSELLEEIE